MWSKNKKSVEHGRTCWPGWTLFQRDNTSMQPWKVQIRTTDCQDVIYSEGVTEDNVEQIADSMEPGTYELKMSWVSRRLADG